MMRLGDAAVSGSWKAGVSRTEFEAALPEAARTAFGEAGFRGY